MVYREIATAFHITPPAFPITHIPPLHTNSHIQYKHIFTCFLSSHFQQTYTVLYKPLTSIHKCRCAHGINTACGHNFFLLEYSLFIQFTAINHPVITHSSTYRPTNLFLILKSTYMHTQTHTPFYLSCRLQWAVHDQPCGLYNPPICSFVFASRQKIVYASIIG